MKFNTKVISSILAYEGLALLAFGVLSIFFASEAILFAILLLVAGVACLFGTLILGGISIKERLVSRGTKYGTNAIVYAAVVLALLVAANYLGASHNKEFDLTSIGQNTLSDQSVKVLQSLQSKVMLYAFMKPGEDIELKPMMERYKRLSDQFDFEIVDPDLHPEIVQRFEVTERGQMVVTNGTRDTILVGHSEEEITNAIVKISKEQQSTIYFLEGHGEVALEGKEERGFMAVKMGLENENYIVKKLLLETMPGVPPDSKALVVAGPTKKLPETAVEKIDRYLANGGRVLLMLDPQTDTGLEPLAASYGITPANDIIVDQQVRLFEGATLGIDPIVSDFPAHEITKNFDQPVLFPQTRSLILGNDGSGMFADPLARTSDSSWGETEVAKLFESGEVTLDASDKKGPLVVAAALTKEIGPIEDPADEPDPTKAKKEIRLVVVGDSDFATNQYINYLYNAPLFLNMIHWLSGEEYLVAIPPRSYAPSTVILTPKDKQLVFMASVFLVPQIILMLGIGAILRRRGK